MTAQVQIDLAADVLIEELFDVLAIDDWDAR